MPNTEKDKATYYKLIGQAKEAAKAYYETGDAIMSDDEYDTIIETISYFEVKYGWDEATDLINSVAAGVSDGGEIVHTHPMLSLSKTKTLEDLASFVLTMKKKTGNQELPLIVEPKLDGLAISAVYENGSLTQVAVRGNGVTGENVTNRVPPNVTGLPRTVKVAATFEVRGELYISGEDFIRINQNRVLHEYKKWVERNPDVLYLKTVETALKDYVIDSNKKTPIVLDSITRFESNKHIFANSRNAVSGLLRRDDREYPVYMSFAAYDAFLPTNKNFNHVQKMAVVNNLGFQIAMKLIPASVRNYSVIETVKAFGNFRSEAPYPTDGVVVKASEQKDRETLGEGTKNPNWAIAYKYPSQYAETIVQDVEVSVGRTGRLALKAKVAPTVLDGTVISYVSLHNVSWLQERDIRIGDTVKLKRANDVIPYIDAPVLERRPADSVKWEPPLTCPNCGEEWDRTTLLWRCATPSCGVVNGIIYAGKRDILDWEGLSEAIITRLNDVGLVNDIADVFELTVEQLAALDMARVNKQGEQIVLGQKVAAKIYQNIQKSKEKPLANVLASLGIRTLGTTIGRWLSDTFKNMDEILAQTPETLMNQVHGIGAVKARLIVEGLTEQEELINRLRYLGVTMAAPEPAPPVPVNRETPPALNGHNGNLIRITGQSVCITGAVPGYTRVQLERKLRDLRAFPMKKVTSTTNLLVADAVLSQNNSKYRDAVRLGVPIISPNEFLKAIGD